MPLVKTMLRRAWGALGPGLTTGAADDDPSGIATYSQAGAQFGYTLTWTMALTLPFMAAIQLISALIGWHTKKGLAANIAASLPRPLLLLLVALLVIANTVNIAADLAAMGEVLRLVIGGSALLYALAFGVACLLAEIVVPYHSYAGYLKFLTWALLAYVATAFLVACALGRGAALDAAPVALAQPRSLADGRRHLRHDDQPLSLLLAGLAGGGGVAAQPSLAAIAATSNARGCFQSRSRWIPGSACSPRT